MIPRPGTRLTNVVYRLIGLRRSCRDMNGKPVNYEDIKAIVEAGVKAPTSSNSQNVRFLVLWTAERMKELGKLKAPKSVVSRASAGVLVMTEEFDPAVPEEKYIWKQLWPQNAAAAMQNMLLMATALGVASCWISFVDDMSGTRLTSKREWRELFPEYDIPSNWSVQGLVILGHTDNVDMWGFPKGDKKHGGRNVRRPRQEEFILEPRNESRSDSE